MNILKSLDYYDVSLKLHYKEKDQKYRSNLGGATTIIIFLLSLLYCVKVIYDWQNGIILPTMSTIQDPQKGLITHSFTDGLLNIYYKKTNESSVDPFDQSSIMFLPQIRDNVKAGINFKEQQSVYKSQSIEVNGGYISYNPDPFGNQEDPTKDLQIIFVKCSTTNIAQNQTCASDSDIQKFLSQGLNTFIFEFKLHQISPKDGQLRPITKTVYMTLDISTQQNIQIIYKKAKSTVDTGFLFVQETDSQFVNNIQIIALSTSTGNLDAIFGDKVYLLFNLRLDSMVEQITLTFPKIGDILSEMWAVASLLITAGELMRTLNERNLEQDMLQQVMGSYYPQLAGVKINYDLFGRIKNIMTDGQKFDMDHLKQQVQVLKSKAKQKLTFSNIIYEISRLQFLVQSLLERSKIQNIRGIGIPIQMQDMSVIDMRIIPFEDPFQNLCDEDFTIISQNQQT